MKLIKDEVMASPEKVNRGSFMEFCPKNEKGIPTSNGVHRVKLLRGEEGTNKDYKTQKDVGGINLFFEENGVEKKYFVPKLNNDKNKDNYGKFHYLFEKFADIEEGAFLDMEFVKKGMIGFIDVRPSGGSPVVDTDEIPVINAEDEPQDYAGN